MMFTKDQRVRIYSPAVGELFGTVVQNQQVTLVGPILVHIDGTREFDYRWLDKDLLLSEHYEGEYSVGRVSDRKLL